MSQMPSPIRLVPIPGLPEVEPGSDLAELIRVAAQKADYPLGHGQAGCHARRLDAPQVHVSLVGPD